MPVKIESMGRCGTVNITFACTGCKLHLLNFKGSAIVEGTKRSCWPCPSCGFFNHKEWLRKV